MAITLCGHGETFVRALAEALKTDEEDVEEGLIIGIAHQYYTAKHLPSDCRTDKLVEVIESDIRNSRALWDILHG